MKNVTRGIRNNNPFNIKISNNSWLGKVKYFRNSDKAFEHFRHIDYGLRAGILLLRGYIFRGYDTPRKIINRFAPSSENNVEDYLHWIYTFVGLSPDEPIRFNTMEFYKLCSAICMYESRYELSISKYIDVCKRFRMYIPFLVK